MLTEIEIWLCVCICMEIHKSAYAFDLIHRNVNAFDLNHPTFGICSK